MDHCDTCHRQPGSCHIHNAGRDYGASDADIARNEDWVASQRPRPQDEDTDDDPSKEGNGAGGAG